MGKADEKNHNATTTGCFAVIQENDRPTTMILQGICPNPRTGDILQIVVAVIRSPQHPQAYKYAIILLQAEDTQACLTKTSLFFIFCTF